MSEAGESATDAQEDYMQPTAYAQEQEEKHRRKIILPYDIPWEYGTNIHASQKGTRGFGAARGQVTNVQSTKTLSDSSDGVVPQFANPAFHNKKLANQSGMKPYGGLHENIKKTTCAEQTIDLSNLVPPNKKDPSDRFLTKWAKPNLNRLNNADVGKRRGNVTEIHGALRQTGDERRASESVLPKLMDMRTLPSTAGTGAGLQGYHGMRQATIKIDGAELTDQQMVDSKLNSSWISGWQTMQSQSRTGGFNAPRDPVKGTYYTKPVKKIRVKRFEGANDRERETEVEALDDQATGQDEE